MKVQLWGGPLDGQELELDYVAQPGEELMQITLPDPVTPQLMLVYQQSNRMKGQRRIFRIVQGPGC